MVYVRLALIAALLAVLGTACGGAPASESATPPAKAVARQAPTVEPTAPATSPAPTSVATATQRPVSAPTPVPTTILTPAPAPLPLGESTLEAVEFFYELPEVVARAALAKTSDSNTWDPNVGFWINQLEWRIAASPMIYQMYTWAHYPFGTYPNVEQFMVEFLRVPQAYAQMARDWLDSDPCTWPEEVQAQVVALEREAPGRLDATIISVSHPRWMAEPAMESITINAKSEYYENPEGYLNRFRCTGAGGRAAIRTPTVPTPSPMPTRVPTTTPTPAPEVLTAPREPRLARELVVSYLAEKLGQGSASRNVQYRADRLAYLTESAPWVLQMYLEAGYRMTAADEPDFYLVYVILPSCVINHLGLSEGQFAAFATEFSRRWPDVNPRTVPGIAALEEMAEAQQEELCTLFATSIETKKPD